MSIRTTLSPAIHHKFTIKKPRSAPRFCQKTYVATGQHEALIAIPDDNPEGYIEQLDEYNFQEISDEFFNDGTPYPFPIVFYGPGPEEDTSAHVLLIADTTATGVDPQIPGALSVLSSPAITYKTPYANGCPVTAPYGASLAITYQVLDSSSQHAAIANSNMEPKEQTSSLVINGVARGSGPVTKLARYWTEYLLV